MRNRAYFNSIKRAVITVKGKLKINKLLMLTTDTSNIKTRNWFNNTVIDVT